MSKLQNKKIITASPFRKINDIQDKESSGNNNTNPEMHIRIIIFVQHKWQKFKNRYPLGVGKISTLKHSWWG